MTTTHMSVWVQLVKRGYLLALPGLCQGLYVVVGVVKDRSKDGLNPKSGYRDKLPVSNTLCKSFTAFIEKTSDA